MAVVRGPWSDDVSVVHIDEVLRRKALRHSVLALLRGGQRNIRLDLARLRQIDAAGLGELVRVYNIAAAANARLRVVNVTPWVRKLLNLVGLYELLSGDRPRACRTSNGVARLFEPH
jgi:anti-anti-sigma factor